MKRIISISLCLILTVTAVLVFYRITNIKNKFPMWEAVAEPRETLADVAVNFVKMEVDYDERYFKVEVDISNQSDTPVRYGQAHYLDYEYGETWYMVDYPSATRSCSVSLESDDTGSKIFYIPRAAMTEKGRYRLSVPGAGYCYIDIE